MSIDVDELDNLEQAALCTLQAEEWRPSKFFGDVFRDLERKGLAVTRIEPDGLTSGKLTEEGALLAEPLRKKRKHRRVRWPKHRRGGTGG